MKKDNIFIIIVLILNLINAIYPVLFGPVIKIVLSFLFLFFITGYLVVKLFFKTGRNISLHLLSLSISLSVSITTIMIFISYFFNLSFLYLILLISFLDIILVAFIEIIKFSRYNLLTDEQIKNNFNIYVLIAIFVVIFLMSMYGPAVDTDGMGTFPYVRAYASQSRISNLSSFYYKNGFKQYVYKYDALVIIYAVLSNLTGLDIIQLWSILTLLFSIAIIVSFYFFITVLFDRFHLKVFSFTIFLCFFGLAEALWIFRTSQYYMIITNFILYPNALALFFKYKREKNIIFLLLFFAISISAGIIHPYALFIVTVSISVFLLLEFIFHKATIKEIIFSIFPVLIFGIVIMLLKRDALEIIKGTPFKWYSLIKLTKKLWYFNPNLYLFAPHYYVKPPFYPRIIYILSFIVLPVLLKYLKKHDWSDFLFSNMIIVPIIMLNPFVLFFAKIINDTVLAEIFTRISQVLPVIPVLGVAVYFIYTRIKNIIPKYFQNFKLTVISIFFIYLIYLSSIIITPTKSLFIHFLAQKQRFKIGSLWKFNPVPNPCLPEMTYPDEKMLMALKFIKENVKEKATFVADLNESMQIATFINSYIVAGIETHIVPMPLLNKSQKQKNRENAVKKILFEKNNLNETRILLKKFDVGYILINLNTNKNYALDKFKKNPQFFSLMYNHNNILIYKVLR